MRELTAFQPHPYYISGVLRSKGKGRKMERRKEGNSKGSKERRNRCLAMAL